MVRQFGWIYLEGFKLCIISTLNGDGDALVFSMNGFSSEIFPPYKSLAVVNVTATAAATTTTTISKKNMWIN